MYLTSQGSSSLVRSSWSESSVFGDQPGARASKQLSVPFSSSQLRYIASTQIGRNVRRTFHAVSSRAFFSAIQLCRSRRAPKDPPAISPPRTK